MNRLQILGRHTVAWLSAAAMSLTVLLSVAAVPAAAETVPQDTVTEGATPTVYPGESLLINGDFEQDASVAWGGTAFIQDGVGFGGSRGMALSATSDSPKKDQFYKKALGIKSDSRYVLTAQYNCSAGRARLWSKIPGLSFSFPPSLDWMTYTSVVRTGSSLALNAGYDFTVSAVENSGIAYVDNLALYEIPATAVEADVELTALTWDKPTVRPGDAVTLTATVQNNGTAALPLNAYKVEFLVDAVVIRTVIPAQPLEAGASTAVSTGALPWTATKGDHWVAARVVPLYTGMIDQNTKNNGQGRELWVDTVDKTVPDIARAAGFTALTFNDECDSLSLIDKKATGEVGYKWYTARPWGGGLSDESDYYLDTVDGRSVLVSCDLESVYNYGLCTFDYRTAAGFSYQNGYMECAFRFQCDPDPEANGYPAVWSLPIDKLQDLTKEWVEVDYLEYYGKNYFTTTFHNSFSDRDTHYRNNNAAYYALGDEQWHTMGFLWTDNAWVSYLDGAEYQRFTYGEHECPDPATGVDGAFSILERSYLPLIISGARGFELELDWIRVWEEPTDAVCTATAVQLDEKELTMYRYERHQLMATQVGAGNTPSVLDWESTDPHIVSIHGDGRLYAQGAYGTATVTVTDRAGHSDSCTVTVVDEGDNLITNGHFESNYVKNWQDFLNHGGVIRDGVGENGSKALVLPKTTFSCFLKNFPAPAPHTSYRLTFRYRGAGVRLWFGTGTDVRVQVVGGNMTLPRVTDWTTATVYISADDAPTINAPYFWCLTRDAAATEETVVDTVSLVELPAVETANLNVPALTLAPLCSETLTLTVTPEGAYAGSAVWTSADETVAKVDAVGKVTGVAPGKTHIVGRLMTGESVVCTVTVDGRANRLICGDMTAVPNTAGWNTWKNNAHIHVVDDPLNAENRCLRVETTGTGQTGSVWYSALPVQCGHTYRLTGRAYGTGVQFYVHGGYATGATGWRNTGAASAGWRDFSFEFTVKDADDCSNGKLNTNYVLAIGNITANAVGYVDDLYLTDVNAVEPPAVYTVTYLSRGRIVLSQTVPAGTTVVPPAAPRVPGYLFSHWDAEPLPLTADTVIQAVFTTCPHAQSHAEGYREGNCQTYGYSGDAVCDACGAVLAAGHDTQKGGHTYVTTVVSPTPTENGYTLHRCTQCGDSYRDNETVYQAPTGASLTIGSARATRGSTVKLPLTVTDNPGMAALCITVVIYDPDGMPVNDGTVTVTAAGNGTVMEALTVGKNLIWDADGSEEDGSLGTLTVSVADTVTQGAYRVDAIVRQCLSPEESDLALTVVAGTVTVGNILYGDATGDIAVDSKDVVRLRKYLAAYDFETKTSTVDIHPGGDANGDNTIDSKDVVRLRKYLAAYDFETGTSAVILGPV